MATNLPDIVQRSRSNGLLDFDASLEIAEAEQEKYRGELSSLEERKKTTRGSLQELEARAVQVRQASEIWTVALRSPICRLPPELLSRVFVLSCLGDMFDPYPPAVSRDLTTLPTSHIIVQVSKYWRDVAKGTPQVWNHWVVLDVRQDADGHRLEKLFPQISNLYGRNLTRVHYWVSFTNTFLTPLRHTGQYTSLNIGGSLDTIRNMQGATDMPLLEELLISESSSPNSPPIVFNTPKLKSLSLYASSDVLSRFVLPWNQITYFSYGPGHALSDYAGEIAPNVLAVLQKLPNLTYLHLTSSRNFQRSIRLDPHITLPNLHTLEIHDHKLSLLGRHPILHCLCAPLLERFDLVIPGGTVTSSIEPYNHASQQLTAFLQTSSCLQQIRFVFILHGTGHGVSFAENLDRTTAKTIHVQGKAPVFRELPSKILPNGHIKEDLGYAKVLNSPKQVSLRNFVTLARYIDRFLECLSLFETSSENFSANDINPPIDAVGDPSIKVLCDILSGFTDNDLNMELYLQTSLH